MNHDVRPGVGTSSEPGHSDLKEDPVERDLDEALEDTFPASDPISITPDDAPQRESESSVDKALEDSFPASDPPAPAQPDKT